LERPGQTFAEIEDVGDDENREKRGLGEDQREDADRLVAEVRATARWAWRFAVGAAAIIRTSSLGLPDASGPTTGADFAPLGSANLYSAVARWWTIRASTHPRIVAGASPERSERKMFTTKISTAIPCTKSSDRFDQVKRLETASG